MDFYFNNSIKFFNKNDLKRDHTPLGKIIFTPINPSVKTHLFKHFNIEYGTAFVNNSNITGKEVMLYG